MTQREKAQEELKAWCKRHRRHLSNLESSTAEWLLALVSDAGEGDELQWMQEQRHRRDLANKISFGEHVLLHYTGEIVNIVIDESGSPTFDEHRMMKFKKTGRRPLWMEAFEEPDLDKPQ